MKLAKVELIKKYLSEFRIKEEDSINPFTEAAITKLVKKKNTMQHKY